MYLNTSYQQTSRRLVLGGFAFFSIFTRRPINPIQRDRNYALEIYREAMACIRVALAKVATWRPGRIPSEIVRRFRTVLSVEVWKCRDKMYHYRHGVCFGPHNGSCSGRPSVLPIEFSYMHHIGRRLGLSWQTTNQTLFNFYQLRYPYTPNESS